MVLYILRHGLAVEKGTPGYPRDFERPLTLEGQRKMRKIAKAIKAMEIPLDLILSSPYLRARQTAQIVAELLRAAKSLEFSDALAPSGSPAKLFELINGMHPQPQSVLLSGHEPYLSRLISLLISGHTDLGVVLKKGGLCKLTTPALEAGRCAALEWLLTPRQMLLMAKA